MTNFFDGLALAKTPPAIVLEYKLYYDDKGLPRFYTMAEEEGDYIVITKEEFAACRYDIKVKNGKITKVQGCSVGKLVPTTIGYGTLANDISIVGSNTYWSTKTYE